MSLLPMPFAESQPTVEYSFPCVRCGYDLRTLPTDGRCPECGVAVALTLTMAIGGELGRTRPGYVRRLTWACRMLFATRVFAFTGALFPFLTRHTGAATYAGFAAASVLCFVGSCLLTAREHPHLPLETARSASAIRILTLTALLLFAPYLAGETMRELRVWNFLMPLLDRHRRLCDYLCVVAAGLYMIYPALEMHIIVRLSKRLADTGLGQRALVTGIAGTAAGGVICLIGLAMQLFPQLEQTVGPQPLGYACAAMICIVLTCWLWTAWNCLLAARIFAKATRHAAARWDMNYGL